MAFRVSHCLVLSSALCLCAACDDAKSPEPLDRNLQASAPDRLRPGETLPGRERVFGIELPRGLSVAARFPEFVQLTGRVRSEDVANHFRKHVVAEHVELGTHRTVFPRAMVKGDEKRRIFRIDITRDRRMTYVKIRDITQAPVTQGLSEKERWDRAGRNPDGTLKDRQKVY